MQMFTDMDPQINLLSPSFRTEVENQMELVDLQTYK